MSPHRRQQVYTVVRAAQPALLRTAAVE